MGSITLDIWLLILGAVAGIAGGLVARGRGRVMKSAVAGAIAVVLATLLRGWL
ncbi:hypothetical protein [Loktanella sp. S4079]|uniref:hypothetical protein n=1 Tax=Loktanella sp. S4079 TaxID=579483 RepID=UPI000AA5D741|nr:hypothetical protein [Loktanella sp. S4079]